ncbi:nudix family, putative [Ichthyophthirius multifiliis]|uniref:Nudix family, putative n=1 Tax=Ichthyophthirius multifiliis TaxID=5932 RepID=G0QSK4_ICHMU|nr:nudix family, putative [Ichthyophthirius multifiliis]EGR31803.1 nudix family, putative [Ichthyophthirius multifiliis]|eukprot:XP_004035289.1 nudix family, putative [Ichthyophthirius multifiliis]
MKKQVFKNAYTGKWLKFLYVDYENKGKLIKNYEIIQRVSNNNDQDNLTLGKTHGVSVYPIIDNKKLIVIANFRIPVNKYVLEIPSGLLESQDYLQEGLRELKEETGYLGQKEINILNGEEQPFYYIDPWKSNESGRLMLIHIDQSENGNIQTDLEDAGDINVHIQI